MTTIYGVMAALEKSVRAGVANVVNPANPPVLLPIDTGVGWPPITALQNVARGGKGLISVYDRKVGRNTTRWSPFSYDQVTRACNLTTTVLAPSIIPSLQLGGIVLGGSAVAGDAVSCCITAPVPNAPSMTAAVVAIAVDGDTPAIMATKLAGLINADPVLKFWVAAAAVGAQVNLSNLLYAPLDVTSFAGSGGSQTRELGRRESQLQIVIWAQTHQAREAIVEPVQGLLAAAQVNFGVTAIDGTQARLEMQNDYAMEDNTLADVYRHDFLVLVDFAITTIDQLYAVLAPVLAFQVESGPPQPAGGYIPSLDFSDPRNSQFLPGGLP